MSEYAKLIGRIGIRFSGSPVTLSPQLDDFGIQHVLYHLASERDVAFRVILYVPNLEAHEVVINFPNDSLLEVSFQHDFRPMDKKLQQQRLRWSRDCKYLYRLPNEVRKEQLTASWTNDGFLVIQARRLKPQDRPHEFFKLVPMKVCANLKPFMDIGILYDSLRLHNCEINSIVEYLERKGFIARENDVLRLLLDYPGKPKITPCPSPRKKSTTPKPSPQKKQL